MINSVLLKKFFEAPGLCDLYQIMEVKEFLLEYIKYRDLYRECKGIDPLGLTLESNLGTVEWFLTHRK